MHRSKLALVSGALAFATMLSTGCSADSDRTAAAVAPMSAVDAAPGTPKGSSSGATIRTTIPRDKSYVDVEIRGLFDTTMCMSGDQHIALGHALGSSGSRLLTTLVHALHREQKRYGLATMCVGVGQGIAVIVERA